MADTRPLFPTHFPGTVGRMHFFLFVGIAICGTPTAPAQDTCQIRTNFYLVTGATLGEIHRALQQSRPRGESGAHDGLTTWSIDWQVALARVGEVSQLETFTTRTTIIVTLPRWAAPSNAAPTVVKAWQAYAGALLQHELEHVQLVRNTVAEMHRRVALVPPDTNGGALRQRIQSVARGLLAEGKQKHRDYDARTRHGATQGAVLSTGRHSTRSAVRD